jgi:hypothetical protein
MYEKMVSVTEYSHLALVIQDPVFRVRQGLAGRIMKYLRAKELHIRYLAVLILASYEPEIEWRSQIRGFLIQQSKAQDNGNDNSMRDMHLSLDFAITSILLTYDRVILLRSRCPQISIPNRKQTDVERDNAC